MRASSRRIEGMESREETLIWKKVGKFSNNAFDTNGCGNTIIYKQQSLLQKPSKSNEIIINHTMKDEQVI